MVRIGRYRNQSGPGLATVNANQQLASFTIGHQSEEVTLTTMGAWMGVYSGSPIVRLVLFWSHPDNRPGGVAGYTEEIILDTSYTGGGGGKMYTANLTAPLVVPAGHQLRVGVTSRNGTAGVAMIPAADIMDQPNRNFYRKSISGNMPQDAVGSEVSHQGQLMIYAEGSSGGDTPPPGVTLPIGTNRPPTAPIVQPPFPESWQKPSDVKSFTWVFQDPDALLGSGMINWERTSEVRVILRNRATGEDFWNSGWIAAVRYYGQSITLTYTGPTPEYLVNYDVIYNHRDRRGAASATARRMFFEPGGSVEEPRLPKGRITNLANPGNIVARYNDSDGVASDAMQIELVNEGESRVKLSDVILTTTLSGAEKSLSWSWLDYTLTQGRRFGVRVRARHSVTGVWSDWSPISWLEANAAPSVPLAISPEPNAAFSTKPTLAVTVSDADQPPGQLTVTFQVATDQAFENVIATGNGTRVSPGNAVGEIGRFERDLASTGLVLGNEYWWRTYAFDGFLYSGGGTSAGGATPSTPRRFTYANVPGVTITSPSTIATMSPTFTWTTTGTQQQYRARLTDATGTVVYDSGEVISSVSQHQVHVDGWIGRGPWQNEEELYLTIDVLDALWGSSDPFAITLEYEYPDTPTSVTAMAITPYGHVGTTAIRVEHDVTTYGEEEFAFYRYYRTELTGPEGDAIPGTRVVLLDNTNAGDTVFEDWTVVSGTWYRYEVAQFIYSGVDAIGSLTMAAEAMAEWKGLVLSLPYQPGLFNVHLRFGPPNGGYEHHLQISQARNMISGPRSRKRVAAFGRRQELEANGEYSLIADPATGLSGAELRDRLQALIDCANGADSPDGLPHAVCWREGRGGRHGVLFGALTERSEIIAIGRYRDVWIANLTLQDTEFVLGEGVA